MELRDNDAGHEVLGVFADAFEPQLCKNEKGSAYRGRRMLGCLVRARLRRWELKVKRFQAGHRGEDSDHCLG